MAALFPRENLWVGTIIGYTTGKLAPEFFVPVSI
jgi:hypothetical protein